MERTTMLMYRNNNGWVTEQTIGVPLFLIGILSEPDCFVASVVITINILIPRPSD